MEFMDIGNFALRDWLTLTEVNVFTRFDFLI